MRILSLFIFFIFSAQAEVIVDSGLTSLIQSFGVSIPKIEIPFCNCKLESPEPDPIPGLPNDMEKIGFQKVACPDPWDDRAFYRQVNLTYCDSRFGENASSCVEDDKTKVASRLADAELMIKVEAFTLKRFSEYKETLVTQCCGDKSQCRNRFQAVNLKLDPLSESDSHYDSNTDPLASSQKNTIVITHGKLASAYNTENVERVLLHELGHACQFALISENQDEYKTFTSSDTSCDKNSGLLQFKVALGEDVSQCLIDELESQMNEIPDDQKHNFCFGKWYREAFADMKFRSEFNSPYHWTYDMSRLSTHKKYGSVSKYIRCAFPSEWKQKMCL